MSAGMACGLIEQRIYGVWGRLRAATAREEGFDRRTGTWQAEQRKGNHQEISVWPSVPRHGWELCERPVVESERLGKPWNPDASGEWQETESCCAGHGQARRAGT